MCASSYANAANLQSELAALEQMLEALEAETATLHHDEALQMSVSPVATHRYTPQRALHALRRQSPVRTHARYSFGNENDVTPSPRTVKRIDAPQADSASDDEGDSDDSDASAHRQLRSSRHTQSPHARVRRPVAERIDQDDESAKLSEACYKSLRISAQLAKKMDQVRSHLCRMVDVLCPVTDVLWSAVDARARARATAATRSRAQARRLRTGTTSYGRTWTWTLSLTRLCVD